MNEINENLLESLKYGFIDSFVHSKGVYLPELLVNNKKSGVKVLSAIQKELEQCSEFRFSVAFVTSSGVAVLIQTLKELEIQDVKGKMLVSKYLNFTQPEALRKLLNFRNIELKIATEGDFHSKGYLFRLNKDFLFNLIVGSSNLTQSALCSNRELNMRVTATKESYLIQNALKNFEDEFDQAEIVTPEFIVSYEEIYKQQLKVNRTVRTTLGSKKKKVSPNQMQLQALSNLQTLRKSGQNKALLISATGTGKTYLSAFDAKAFDAKKLLFVVHRSNIASKSKETFEEVFGNKRTFGLYSGKERVAEADFVFSTIQTISRSEHLTKFSKDYFDYIVIDETHRSGAGSYQDILNYFRPKFLLGMTATPERSDGKDIFKDFDHNIAYEIRLHKALEEDMLSPFHYYGITDIDIDNKELNKLSDFNKLTSDSRVKHILKNIRFYGCDNGEIRGLVFCSSVEECKVLADKFRLVGYKTIALTGENTEAERTEAINHLESEEATLKLDYIFTYDIFNEGIDIPKVNQVVLLRPTESAIVFVQQLGRGLRKAEDKEYLTVIDFIGNYTNNYMIPIALYGDNSYNKDTLRKFMVSGSNLIPGDSTINFDRISKERIFESINSANMNRKKDLDADYKNLKHKLGRIPMMNDFLEFDNRDPMHFVNYSKSYYNFVQSHEESVRWKLNKVETELLELFSIEINNGIRVEESIILRELLLNGKVSFKELEKIILNDLGYQLSYETFKSCEKNLNFKFIRKEKSIVHLDNDIFLFHESIQETMKNDTFRKFLEDNIIYAIKKFKHGFDVDKYNNGFVYYRKYKRKDVCRILNWDYDEASTIYGYRTKYNTCPLFVTYHKSEGISETTEYDDGFINRKEFEWMSRSKRTKKSADMLPILNYKNGLRILLFIQKNNNEGDDFYYIGDVNPSNGEESFIETTMRSNPKIPIVKVNFTISQAVEESIYEYICTSKV